jgi:hypothetical protein
MEINENNYIENNSFINNTKLLDHLENNISKSEFKNEVLKPLAYSIPKVSYVLKSK